MKILCVSGYAAWKKVSQGKMPSHHLFGIHEMVDHYESLNENDIRGIIKKDVFTEPSHVDFFLWKSEGKNIFPQVMDLLKMSKKYDLIYDQLNRCSIYLGVLKKIGMLKCKLLTIMHHPRYDLQLKVSDSDGYIFFNNDYKFLAEIAYVRKKDRYYVNEWMPDTEWYEKIADDGGFYTDAYFIDNGKSRRDRECLIKAAEIAEIRVDYAGTDNETEGYARAYSVDLKNDIDMVKRLRKYQAVIVPVLKNEKNKIGPLGITSFLDCIALGLPVVASDNVCFAREITDNNLGLIYETGNCVDLQDKMSRIKNDVELYKLMKVNMKQYAMHNNMILYSDKLKKIILAI